MRDSYLGVAILALICVILLLAFATQAEQDTAAARAGEWRFSQGGRHVITMQCDALKLDDASAVCYVGGEEVAVLWAAGEGLEAVKLDDAH